MGRTLPMPTGAWTPMGSQRMQSMGRRWVLWTSSSREERASAYQGLGHGGGEGRQGDFCLIPWFDEMPVCYHIEFLCLITGFCIGLSFLILKDTHSGQLFDI